MSKLAPSPVDIKYCAKTGCNLPAFIEPRTKIVHKYCGRTHAIQDMGRNAVQRPHGSCQQCNLAGCDKTVAFDVRTGRVHDFCCKDHAVRAIRSGAWVRPVRDQYRHYHGDKKMNAAALAVAAPGFICKLPSCNLPVFQDTRTGRKLDYCGRSHAVEHRLLLERNRSATNNNIDFSAQSIVTTAAVAGGGTVVVGTSGVAISPTSRSSNSAASNSSNHLYAEAAPTLCVGTAMIENPHRFDNLSLGHLGNRSNPSGKALPVTATLKSPGTGDNRTLTSILKNPSNVTAKKLAPPVATTSVTARNNNQTNNNNMTRKRPSSATTAASATNNPASTGPSITHPQCTVCLCKNANVILIPCGHVCLCQDDADKLKASNQLVTCPICRQSITSTNKVFLNHS